jgi:hypothetical protein
MSNQSFRTPHELQQYLDSLPPTPALDLSDVHITSLRGVRFPDHITTLNLGQNQIVSLEGVQFPNALTKLVLDHNLIESLDQAQFPDSLRSLALDHNQIESLDGVVFPNDLVMLYLHHNPINMEEIVEIVPPHVRLRAEADDYNLETMHPARFAQRLNALRNRHHVRAQVQPTAVRIARTYQEYLDMCRGAANTTVDECNEAVCSVCLDPYVKDGRLLRPVVFHATHKSDGSVMWTHPSHLAEIKDFGLHGHSKHYKCPLCRCKLGITPVQLRKSAVSTLQKVMRGHKTRKDLRKSSRRSVLARRPHSWTKSRTSALSRTSHSRKSRHSADF